MKGLIMRLMTFFITLVCILGCRPNEEELRRLVREELSTTMKREVVTNAKVIGPYSPAVRVGNFLFVSGQIGLHPETGQLVSETVEAETHQVLDNLMRLLKLERYDSSHVVSATVYLRNMNDYPRMNAVYGSYFQEGNYPARATVEVSRLPKEANVEIAVIAWKP